MSAIVMPHLVASSRRMLGSATAGSAAWHGADIVRADQLMHGKTDMIHHDGRGLFAGLDNPFQATRYHSLIVKPDTLPEDFEVAAWCEAPDGTREIMAIRHKTLPMHGVQFHPESFLTPCGIEILKKFIALPKPNVAKV